MTVRRSASSKTAPGPLHLLGVVEPPGRVAVQGPAEEGGQPVADGRVEPLGLDRQRGVDQRRVRPPPPRQGAGGHLVERDPGRVPLGRLVPARWRAFAKERVEVGAGADPDLVRRHPSEREVEQDELEPALAGTDADVVGLDVAVGDAVPLQRGDRLEQVVAEPLEQLQPEPGLLAEPLGQRLVARLVEHQDGPALDLADVVQADDELAADPLQGLGLVAEPAVDLRVAGDLQHELLVAAAGQQGDAGGPLAEEPLDDEAALDAVAGPGRRRVDLGPGVGRRQLVLDVVEQLEEVGRGRHPGVDVGVGAPADQLLQLGPGAVEDRREPQAAVLGERPVDLGGRRARRPAGEEVVGDRPEREDVGRLGRQPRVVQGLGGHVDRRLAIDEVLDVDRGGRGRLGLADADLPVEDLQPRDRGFGVHHQDALRRQGPMEDPLGVGVANGIGELSRQLQPGRRRQGLAAGGQVVVEPHRPGLVGEQQGRAELVVAVVAGVEDAGVVERLEDAELADGRPLEPPAVVLGRRLGEQVLPDPAEDARQRRVLGEPVLVDARGPRRAAA